MPATGALDSDGTGEDGIQERDLTHKSVHRRAHDSVADFARLHQAATGTVQCRPHRGPRARGGFRRLNLKHTNKPNLLILTSSFPRSSDDDTCGYVREFARSLCPDYIVSILAPPDPDADDFRYDDMTVLRSWSPFPSRREPFAGSKDL